MFEQALARTLERLDVGDGMTSAEFIRDLKSDAIRAAADPDDPVDGVHVAWLVLMLRAIVDVGKERAENRDRWVDAFSMTTALSERR